MKIKSILVSLLFACLCLVSCNTNVSSDNNSSQNNNSTFVNPVESNVQLLDPTIILGDDGYYYSYYTGGVQKWDGVNETNCYAPIYKSLDMINWEFVGSAFDERNFCWSPQVQAYNLWSPEIAFINNQYVYYFSLGVLPTRGDTKLNGVGVAVSDYPDGPFEYVGKVVDGYDVDNWDAIDPNIVVDGDKVYMFLGNFDGIFYIELEADGLSAKRTGGKIVPHYVAGSHSESGISYKNYSAPCVIKIKDKWCLFVSTGAWNTVSSTEIDYHTVVFQSDNILGPYIDSSNNSALELDKGDVVMDSGNGFYNPGCAHVYPDKTGDYYILYHSYLEESGGNRYLGLEKLDITGDYPCVKDLMPHKIVETPNV